MSKQEIEYLEDIEDGFLNYNIEFRSDIKAGDVKMALYALEGMISARDEFRWMLKLHKKLLNTSVRRDTLLSMDAEIADCRDLLASKCKCGK